MRAGREIRCAMTPPPAPLPSTLPSGKLRIRESRGEREEDEDEERAIWFTLLSNLICGTVTDSPS